MLNDKTFRSIYSDYLSSGLTVRDFCANQQMNEAKFFYWQHKLKGELPLKKGGFVPVVFDNGRQKELHTEKDINRQGFYPNASPPDKAATCEISYPNGVVVKLNGMTEAEMLRSLLALTRR